MRFSPRQRLRRTAEFQAVRAEGRRIDCGTFLFTFLPRTGDSPVRRLGVIASRRVGNAVVRNQGKRRLREVFRLHQSELPSHCDVVMIVRRSLRNESFARTETRFLKACQRIANSREASR